MTPNNNLSVLPWYTSPDQQNARKWWLYGRVYPLFTPAGYILPFQLIVPHAETPSITSVALFSGNTNESLGEYVTSFVGGGLTVKQFQDYDVVVFPGSGAIFGSMANGRYYLSMEVNGVTYYSEVFTVVNDIQPYLEIEWWNAEDFVMDAGTIVYAEPEFKNRIFLQADIAKPEYLFEEEGENRDGYFFPLKQISEKRYRFSFLASEYLLDVMRFIRMADYVKIIKNSQTYNVDSFLLTPEWEAEGDVASVNVEFDTNTVAKKIPFITQGVIPPTPGEHYLTVSPTAITFLPAGQTVSITVTSDITWALSLPSWLSADVLTGTGNATVQLTAQANSGQSANTGNVVVSGGGITKNISVLQPAPGTAYLSVSPMSINFNAAGQTVSVSVNASAGLAWTLAVPSWVTASQLSGTGSANITLTAPANTTGSARQEAYAVFSASGVSNVNITLNQAAQITPSLEVSPNDRTYNAQQHTFYYQVFCNGRWECSASSAPSWLSCNSSGDGNGTATIILTANSGSQRQGTLTFRMIDYPSVTYEVRITQEAYVPTITYALEFASGHSSHNFAASGGNFTPTVYGVTYQDGTEINRTQLAASALSFSSSGDNITTRSGLQFLASNLGTTETPAKSQIWTLTWSAHSTATATLNLTQSANIRTVVSFTEDTSFPNVPIPVVWSGSGTNEAPSQGDSMTINPTMRYTRVDSIEYSSGVTDTETHTVDLAGQVTVSGDGLSVSGGGNAYVVTYAQNNTSSSRSGTIILTQTEQNPYYPNYYYSENRAVTQAARSYPIAMMASLTDPDTQVSGTYQCTRQSIGANYLAWDSGNFEWTVYTTLNPSRGDSVYLNTGMTMVCGYILDLVY